MKLELSDLQNALITSSATHHSIVAPCFDVTPIKREPLKKRFLRELVIVSKKLGIILIAALICVFANKGAVKLDVILATGNSIASLSYCFSLLIGIITSQIVFE